MPAFPKTEDVNKVREQAAQTFAEAVEQARTPLLAALGAGDLAAQALLDAVNKVRTQLNERSVPADLTELRDRLDPAELRKRFDAYGQSARQFYDYLAERGEQTLHRLQEKPQVKKVWDQVGSAQGKVEETVDEVRDLADDVLGKVRRPFAGTAEEPAAKPAAKPRPAAKTSTRRTTAKPTAARKPATDKTNS
ncbi:hypothetical protein GCM10011581_32420 [Saccharopolyspora subtropica]|uniref:Heparin binding hemagglutinin HbhA n=1 Tax=Saccharopolyspora thermophila TaxID=89367 RepID=A0A917K0Y9_9PSEU|nr:hypothetical protein [Saccharopolyspora subtropica]GGI92743.1 hypothetical protein GCM10011581_32420 [Saccharopolyspora subtropica]